MTVYTKTKTRELVTEIRKAAALVANTKDHYDDIADADETIIDALNDIDGLSAMLREGLGYWNP